MATKHVVGQSRTNFFTYCPACGTKAEEDGKFCGGCGISLSDGTLGSGRTEERNSATPPKQAMLIVKWKGAFALSGQVTLYLDGRTFFTGDLSKQFEANFVAPPGDHTLETSINILGTGIQRRQSYLLSLPEGVTTGTLQYSRAWGNFKKDLAVQRTG